MSRTQIFCLKNKKAVELRFICFLPDNGSNLVADSGQKAAVADLSDQMNYSSDKIWSNPGKMVLKKHRHHVCEEDNNLPKILHMFTITMEINEFHFITVS